MFALPFAYIGALLCLNRVPSAHDLVWITLAMVGARSLAMGLNRLIDARIDARNPRTADRELPSGKLSRVQVIVFCALAFALYLVSCLPARPDRSLAVADSGHRVRGLPVPEAVHVAESHLARRGGRARTDGRVGCDHGPAAVGGLGTRRRRCGVDRRVRSLLLLFDREFDVGQGLHSVAVRFGVHGTFWGARMLHALTVVLLAAVGVGLHLGGWYWAGVVAVAALLAYEHSLVRPGDLRRLNAAFFTVNGLISVVFFAFVLAETVS